MIESTNRKVIYIADGERREWEYDFRVDGPQDLFVYIKDKSGQIQQAITGLHIDEQNHKIVYPTIESGLPPVAAEFQVLLIRETEQTQLSDFERNGLFDAEILEKDLDKLTMEVQDLNEEVKRCMKVGAFQTDADFDVGAIFTQIANALEAARAAQQTAVNAANQAQNIFDNLNPDGNPLHFLSGDMKWKEIAFPAAVPEAPLDGNKYLRKSAAWVAVDVEGNYPMFGMCLSVVPVENPTFALSDGAWKSGDPAVAGSYPDAFAKLRQKYESATIATEDIKYTADSNNAEEYYPPVIPEQTYTANIYKSEDGKYKFVDKDTYDQIVNLTGGSCKYFCIDIPAKRFLLPLNKHFWRMAANESELDYEYDQIRPMKGVFPNGNEQNNSNPTGVFKKIAEQASTAWKGTAWPHKIGMQTQQGGAIFSGKHARPKSMGAYCYFKLKEDNMSLSFSKWGHIIGNIADQTDLAEKFEDVDDAIEAEASARIAAINAEEASREHVDAGLNELISNEVSRAQEAEEALDAAKINISSVPLGTSGPTNNKRTLLQAITIDVISAVSAFISGWSTDIESDGAADIETQVALPIVDDSHAGLMPAADHNQIITNTGAISAEITRATGKENDLQNAIDDEASDRATAVSDEASARATAITGEATARSSADTTLQGNIDAEATARNTAVNAEASARETADTAEATARSSADTTLQGNITAEATARANADTTLQSNIDAETSRATTAESTLGSNKLNKTDVIDNLTGSSATQALSANMGRELKSQLDTVAENGQNRGTFASIAELPTPNSGDYAYLSDISAADAGNTSVFPNGAAEGDTWRVDEANPSGDGSTFVWIGTIKVSEAQRDFTDNPIQAAELAAGAATDANIGTRTLTDAAADSTLVPVAAKALTAWLQGIRNNLKALLAFMSRAAGFATSAQGTKADSAVQDSAYVHTDSNYTAAEKIKLAGIAARAEMNVQSDWNETDTSAGAYIKNKPALATVATSGSYNDLSNKPTIPAAQIQSDWNQTSTSAKDYIKNKPVIPEGAGQATNTTLGVVKGSTAAGQAYVETDGTLSLNGYDALTTGLGNANTAIAGKVDKITGKGLSTNDYTTTEKTKLGTLVAPTPTTYNIASEADVIALNAAIRKTNHNTPITINITGSFSTATSIAFNTVGARLNMTFQNSAVLTYTGTGDTVILSEASELYVVNCRITGNTGTVGLRASRGGVINLTNSPCVIAGCAHAFDAYFGGLIIAQDRMQLTLTGNTYNYPSARIYTEESEIRTKTDAERFLDVIFAKNPDDPASKAWKEPAINPTGDYVNGVLQHPDHSGGAGA